MTNRSSVSADAAKSFATSRSTALGKRASGGYQEIKFVDDVLERLKRASINSHTFTVCREGAESNLLVFFLNAAQLSETTLIAPCSPTRAIIELWIRRSPNCSEGRAFSGLR